MISKEKLEVRMKNSIELFVPGRLCIMGEHSDWAGKYRNVNNKITKGYAIVTGIEEGIYAKATVSEKLIVKGVNNSCFECDMDYQCISGYCSNDLVCAPHPSSIEKCRKSSDCSDPNQFCDLSTESCTDKYENGEYCDDSIECLSNYCNEESECADPGSGPEPPKTCDTTEDCNAPKEKCDDEDHYVNKK